MNYRTMGIRSSRLVPVIVGGFLALLAAGLVLRFTSGDRASSAPPDSAASAAESVAPRSGAQHRARGSGASPPATLQDSNVDPEVARKMALEYGKGRYNAFFDGKMFLANSVASGKLSIKAVKDQLLNTHELEALPANTRFLTAKPPAVLERMAMIDTLEALGEEDPSALEALAEVGTKPIDTSFALDVKRAIAAEKFDIFTALARRNWEVTKDTYQGLQSQPLKDLLKPALIAGLVDSGMPRVDAVRTVEKLGR